MNTTLEIKNLTKHYGRVKAVNELNLTVKPGEIYGILGPNGSGKTTTLGMILDVIAPTSGSYSWFGGKDPVKSRQKIGSILETPCFYSYMTAVQNLRVAAHIKECPFEGIDEILKRVNLYERRHDPFKTFSLGMKQRLSIGAALLADPGLLKRRARDDGRGVLLHGQCRRAADRHAAVGVDLSGGGAAAGAGDGRADAAGLGRLRRAA